MIGSWIRPAYRETPKKGDREMVRSVFCLLVIWPLLVSQVSHSEETCTETVQHKDTMIHHKRTSVDGEAFVSHFHLSHNRGPEEPADVYVEYRIHYLSKGEELFEDGRFNLLIRGKGHDVAVRWPTRPGYEPEKILSVDIVNSRCAD
jgi:hypothetical protein